MQKVEPSQKELYLPEYKFDKQTFDLEDYDFQKDQFNIIADVWLCSSAEKDADGKKFDGAYPKGFLKRLKSSFVKYYPADRKKILHVCSGRISPDEGLRLDISKEYSPDYLCNAEDMRLSDGKLVPSETFEWVISDTPYNAEASKKYYKKPMLNRSSVLRQMNRVCKVGGFIAVLDQIMVVSPPRNLKRVAMIGVTSVPNLDFRVFTVLKKVSKYEGKDDSDNLRLEDYIKQNTVSNLH